MGSYVHVCLCVCVCPYVCVCVCTHMYVCVCVSVLLSLMLFVCYFFRRLTEPSVAAESGSANTTEDSVHHPDMSSMSTSDWEAQWNSMTAEQQEAYHRWYYSQPEQQTTSASEQEAVEKQPEEHASDVARWKEWEKTAVERHQRHLLEMQPPEVQQLDALLNRIDSARVSSKPDNNSSSAVTDVSPTSTSESSNPHGENQPWWEVLSAHPSRAVDEDVEAEKSGDSPTEPGERDDAAGTALQAEENGSSASSDYSDSGDADSSEEESEKKSTEQLSKGPVFTTEYKEYTVQGNFNRFTGKFQRVDDAGHWAKKGLPEDRSMRQMAHHFNPSILCEPPDVEEPPAKRKKLSQKEIKQLKEQKKAQKQKALIKAYAL